MSRFQYAMLTSINEYIFVAVKFHGFLHLRWSSFGNQDFELCKVCNKDGKLMCVTVIDRIVGKWELRKGKKMKRYYTESPLNPIFQPFDDQKGEFLGIGCLIKIIVVDWVTSSKQIDKHLLHEKITNKAINV
jgi:hypothetical protein